MSTDIPDSRDTDDPIPLSADDARRYLEQTKSMQFFTAVEERGSLPARIKYYELRGPRRRALFRISGVMVIAFSSALPVLASFGTSWFSAGSKDALVAVIAALIALLTGLNSFYRWDATWRSYTQTLFTLYAIRAEWESQCTEAEVLLKVNPAEAVTVLRAARDKALADAESAVRGEMQEYFSKQSCPEPKSVTAR
jgi:hypothetical protein